MNKKQLIVGLITMALSLVFYSFLAAEDKICDATVTTDSGTYSAPVGVEDEKVITRISWSNARDMIVSGVKISDGQTDGVNFRGDSAQIEDNDSNFESKEQENK